MNKLIVYFFDVENTGFSLLKSMLSVSKQHEEFVAVGKASSKQLHNINKIYQQLTIYTAYSDAKNAADDKLITIAEVYCNNHKDSAYSSIDMYVFTADKELSNRFEKIGSGKVKTVAVNSKDKESILALRELTNNKLKHKKLNTREKLSVEYCAKQVLKQQPSSLKSLRAILLNLSKSQNKDSPAYLEVIDFLTKKQEIELDSERIFYAETNQRGHYDYHKRAFIDEAVKITGGYASESDIERYSQYVDDPALAAYFAVKD